MSAPDSYTRIQITLHWTIAALVILQFFVNADVRDAFRRRIEGDAQAGLLAGLEPAALLHIISGLTILALTALRLVIRLMRGTVPPEEGVPRLFAALATVAHVALYGFLFLMPVTGALAWFGASALSGTLHEIGRLILIPLVIGHAAGALAEHFVYRNDTLRRMFRASAR